MKLVGLAKSLSPISLALIAQFSTSFSDINVLLQFPPGVLKLRVSASDLTGFLCCPLCFPCFAQMPRISACGFARELLLCPCGYESKKFTWTGFFCLLSRTVTMQKPQRKEDGTTATKPPWLEQGPKRECADPIIQLPQWERPVCHFNSTSSSVMNWTISCYAKILRVRIFLILELESQTFPSWTLSVLDLLSVKVMMRFVVTKCTENKTWRNNVPM